MTFLRLLAVLVLLFCLLPTAKCQDDDDAPAELLPISPEIETAAERALQACEPKDGKVTGEINKNRVYTLTGDIFHNGRIFAIIDDDTDVIVCEWQKPGWKVVSALAVQTVWNFPPDYRVQTGRGPDNQPQPFWVIEMQNRPLLVIASHVDKEGQHYDVILFDLECKQILSQVTSFSTPPAVKSQYLITGDSSRVKSEWEATYFSRIRNNAFVMTKSWEDSQPWHSGDWEGHPDDSSSYARSDGKGYLILPDNSVSKTPADYLIFRCDSSEKWDRRSPASGTEGKPFAAIYCSAANGAGGEDELQYVFEKLTGLPGELYPGYDSLAPTDKVAPRSKVKVRGTDKALVKLLVNNKP